MNDAWFKYHDRLLDIYVEAGSPSSRQIASVTKQSHTTVNHLIRGHRLGSWDAVLKIVKHLDEEKVAEIRDLFRDAERELIDGYRSAKEPQAPMMNLNRQILEELRAIRTLLERRFGNSDDH